MSDQNSKAFTNAELEAEVLLLKKAAKIANIKISSLEEDFKIVDAKILSLKTANDESEAKILSLEKILKELTVDSHGYDSKLVTKLVSNEYKITSMKDETKILLNEESVEADIARYPIVERINNRIHITDSITTSYDFFRFYFTLKEAFTGLGYINEFEEFEDGNVNKLASTICSKILGNLFTTFISKSVSEDTYENISTKDGTFAPHLHGFQMLDNLLTNVVGERDEEINPLDALSKVRFGVNFDNTAALKIVVRNLKLIMKIYETTEELNEHAIMRRLANNIPYDIQQEITYLAKQKRGDPLEKKIFSSNFITLEKLYEYLDLWTKENKVTKNELENIIPPATVAKMHGIKKDSPQKTDEPQLAEYSKPPTKLSFNSISISHINNT